MGTFEPRRRQVALAVLAAGSMTIAVALVPCAAGAATATAGSWASPNGTMSNTRDAVGSTISSQNVASLKKAWAFDLPGKGAATVGHYGSLAANPIVEDGVVYIQDLECNVYALSLATGALLWEYRVDQPEKSGPGPNGVTVVHTVVYGIAPTSAFALRAKSGKPIWVNHALVSKGQGTIGIQPQVATGRVYLASQYGSGPGGGVLMALDASTGTLEWKFNTSTGYSPGVKALGVGTGGAWEPPLVGSDGSVTYGIGNPYQQYAAAVAHPARQLYSDSDVNLTAATGKLRWYYQGVTNDFMDWDMQASPIAATARGRAVVIGSGKMGYVYAMDAATGALVWKTPVGKHDGNDTDGLLALEHKHTPTPPFTVEPGGIGGVLTNLALAGTSIYAVTVNLPFKISSSTTADGGPANDHLTGEIEALNLVTGHVEWSTDLKGFPAGAATVSNDLVFTTLLSGQLVAVNRTTGAIVYHHTLPTTTNAPIAIAGNTIVVPAGSLKLSAASSKARRHPQVVAYRVG